MSFSTTFRAPSGRAALLLGGALAIGVVPAQAALPLQGGARGAEPLEARVRIDRGVDPVLQKGDQVRVYLWASRDAYLAVFRVDPDGRTRLVLPAGPSEPHRVEGGRDYQLPAWQVEGQPGLGYYFVLASAAPFDFGRLKGADGTSEWELARSGIRIRQDPHLAMEGLARVLLPEGSGSPGTAVDFAAFHVSQTYSYPRFLCYECHEAQAFESWNPYLQACPSVRVVISSDPYFYPSTRYQGMRPAFPNPPAAGLAQFAVRARQPGEPGTPLVAPRAEDPARTVAVAGGADSRALMLEFLERSGVVLPAAPEPPATPLGAPRAGPVVPPAAAAAPGPLDPRPATLVPTGADAVGRPILQRRADQPDASRPGR